MKKRIRSASKAGIPAYWLILLVLVVLGGVQLVRAATGGIQGSPGTKYDTAQFTDSVTTSDENYSTIPGLAATFSTASSGPAAATVSVSSPTTNGFPGCGFFMRIAVDGTPVPGEVAVLFQNWDARSFTFTTPSLTVGSHTVAAQWRQQLSYFGSTGCSSVRSLVVMHQ